MWDTTISLQPKIFIYSVILGIIISLIFDLFKSFRKIKDYSNLQVFFQDIAFFLIVTPTVFIFLLAFTYGILRGYVFIGIISGFILWRFTLSRYFVLILSRFLWAIKKIFSTLSSKVSLLSEQCLLIFLKKAKKLLKLKEKAVIFCKKTLEKAG